MTPTPPTLAAIQQLWPRNKTGAGEAESQRCTFSGSTAPPETIDLPEHHAPPPHWQPISSGGRDWGSWCRARFSSGRPWSDGSRHPSDTASSPSHCPALTCWLGHGDRPQPAAIQTIDYWQKHGCHILPPYQNIRCFSFFWHTCI
jgi:hypothetical protein